MVILAPICEETFFRGLVQRGYESYSKKYGFVYAGLIFGLFHMLNGMVNVLPACIIGLALGYLVYRSGSIYTSMLAHGANNACAIILGGVFSMIKNDSIPSWLHLIGFAGLAATLLLLAKIKVNNNQEEFVKEIPLKKIFPLKSIIFLILSTLSLVAAGIVELLTRLGKITY